MSGHPEVSQAGSRALELLLDDGVVAGLAGVARERYTPRLAWYQVSGGFKDAVPWVVELLLDDNDGWELLGVARERYTPPLAWYQVSGGFKDAVPWVVELPLDDKGVWSSAEVRTMHKTIGASLRQHGTKQ